MSTHATPRPPRVLVSDSLAPTALAVFERRGVQADLRPELGKDPAALAATLPGYDGLAVRSATQVTGALLQNAPDLQVVGRAGIGVDNVDLEACSRQGVLVMNTPFGNSVTTAEHTIALMFAAARHIADASASTHAGKWEKSAYLGTELSGKTLGVVGAGNIGALVIERAQALGLRVIVHDPYLSAERADRLGVVSVGFEELLERSEVITLHVPLTENTRGLVDAAALARTRPGVIVINCARGGLVDEAALADAVRSGHVSAAAVDVFETEPPTGSPLLGLERVVCTPHLGASTAEAQERVAVQLADQMADLLLDGTVAHALNAPSVSAEEAASLRPWVRLAEDLGSVLGQATPHPVHRVTVQLGGDVRELNTRAVRAAAIAGVMRARNPQTTLVSAPVRAAEQGIEVVDAATDASGPFRGEVRVTLTTGTGEQVVRGTVFEDGRPRLVEVDGIVVDAVLAEHMLFTRHCDRPGAIGRLGTLAASAGINIASFSLGRTTPGGDAVALLGLDEPVSAEAVQSLRASGVFREVVALRLAGH